MSYTALYRKFRPVSFSDVKGQEHIVTTLSNQLRMGRIGHAYLFCGTRGTGKTTVAKILARAVNCEAPREDGSPCNECAQCAAILSGSSLNVAEIDAASNNGVDNVRDIIEELSYPPVDAKYRVYIMDEAHMLSPGAANALLKTLEEPPSYVIFILATTDPAKLPVTILSRCQRYDFKRISIDTIAARMKELTTAEGIEVEDKAIRYVARAADGSMRDGLSLLDQCVAFHFGETLTYEHVLDVLGAVDTDVFSRLVRAIMQNDVLKAMALVEEVVMQGREIGQFVTDFLWYLRNIMLLRAADGGDMEELLNISPEHLALLKEEAGQLEMSSILRYIQVFSELQQAQRYASQKRILLEMYLIRLMRPQMDVDVNSLLERVRELEKTIEKGIPVAYSAQMPPAAAPASEKEKVKLEAAVPEDIQQVVREWPVILGKTDHLMKALLKTAELSMGEKGSLLICVNDSLKLDTLRQQEEALKELIDGHIGKDVPMQLMLYDAGQQFDTQFADLKEILNIQYEVEE